MKNTISVKPVFVEIPYDRHDKPMFVSTNHEKSIQLNDDSNLPYSKYYMLILLSLEKDIVFVGDTILCEDAYANKCGGKVIEILSSGKTLIIDKNTRFGISVYPNWNKTTRDGSKLVSAKQDQLSPELIARLIEEYNSGGMKNFEIESEASLSTEPAFAESKPIRINKQPKLKNGFVVPIEKEKTLSKDIIEFQCKATKDSITIFGAGKFDEERLILDKAKASLLFIELWKFLELSQGIVYTEEEVRTLFIARSKEFSTKSEPFNSLLLKQDLEWFEQNKKKS